MYEIVIHKLTFEGVKIVSQDYSLLKIWNRLLRYMCTNLSEESAASVFMLDCLQEDFHYPTLAP